MSPSGPLGRGGGRRPLRRGPPPRPRSDGAAGVVGSRWLCRLALALALALLSASTLYAQPQTQARSQPLAQLPLPAGPLSSSGSDPALTGSQRQLQSWREAGQRLMQMQDQDLGQQQGLEDQAQDQGMDLHLQMMQPWGAGPDLSALRERGPLTAVAAGDDGGREAPQRRAFVVGTLAAAAAERAEPLGPDGSDGGWRRGTASAGGAAGASPAAERAAASSGGRPTISHRGWSWEGWSGWAWGWLWAGAGQPPPRRQQEPAAAGAAAFPAAHGFGGAGHGGPQGPGPAAAETGFAAGNGTSSGGHGGGGGGGGGGRAARKLIEGGQMARISEYPYVAVITRPDGTYLCAGSLIHPRVVATAAHCVSPAVGGTTNPRVHLGLSRLTPTASAAAFAGPAAGILAGALAALVSLGSTGGLAGGPAITSRSAAHPRYNPGNFDFDVAVLVLDSDAPPAARVVSLPPRAGARPPAPYDVLGWGATEANTLSEALRVGQVRPLDERVCGNLFKPYGTQITSRMLCMTGITCAGDSGGPLVQASGEPVLLGQVSFGFPRRKGQGCPSPNPATVFSDVSHPDIHDWLQTVIAGVHQQLADGLDPTAPPPVAAQDGEAEERGAGREAALAADSEGQG